jgi:hypothetical protein
MKKIRSIFLVILLTLPIILAQSVVEVAKEEEKTSIWSAPFQILKSRIFWGGVVLFALFVGILIGLFFIVRWVVKFIKSRSDAFWRLRSERIKLSKTHRRYPSKAWFKIEKNTPIRLVKKEGDKLIVTRPIGYHRGDYVTHEGNVIISMNLVNNNKWFFFPITDILIIPNKDNMEIITKNIKGKKEIVKLENLPKPSEIVRFNENEIQIFAESLSYTGMFLIPVLKSKEGKIIDLSMPVFDSLKQVVLGEYLYEQTDEFSRLAKKSMDINPNLRYQQKASDNSQSVEIPSSAPR